MMSTTTKGNLDQNKGRVQVDNLEQQERELKNHEAESIKGGGAAMGGVDMRKGLTTASGRSKGEEIPT